MEPMAADALSLPELVLRIGMWIPIWIPPKESVKAPTTIKYTFKPKDLLAAIAVNRLFHFTLTPLLWIVYNEFAINPTGFIDHAAYRDYYSRHTHPPTPPKRPEHVLSLATLNANCYRIRYLDLLACDHASLYMFQQPLMFEFQNCTHLRELRLSHVVDPVWAAQLIKANHNLTLLDWSYPAGRHHGKQPRYYHGILIRDSLDLEYLSGLHKLQTLRLERWAVCALHLARILDNNAHTLERLDLARSTSLEPGVVMKSNWSGPEDSALAKMEKQELANVAKWTTGRPLVLSNLKTLWLTPLWEFTVGQLVADLLGAMPALETLYVQPVHRLDTVLLSQALRQSCPRLNAILVPEPHPAYLSMHWSEQVTKTTNLVQACSPGNLVHLRISVVLLDDALTTLLLAIAGKLETLDITLSNSAEAGVKNLTRVLKRCQRLRRFSLHNIRVLWLAREAATILGRFKPDHLESLVLTGFLPEGEDEDDDVSSDSEVSDRSSSMRDNDGNDNDENSWETEDIEEEWEEDSSEEEWEEGSSFEYPEDHLFDISHKLPQFDPSLTRAERDMMRVFSDDEEEEYKEDEDEHGEDDKDDEEGDYDKDEGGYEDEDYEGEIQVHGKSPEEISSSTADYNKAAIAKETEKEQRDKEDKDKEHEEVKPKKVEDTGALFESQGDLPAGWHFVEEDRSVSLLRADFSLRTIASMFVLDKPTIKMMVLNCEVYRNTGSL